MLELFKTRQGIIFISIIWGLGLSCLFRQVCKGRNCIVIKAPNPNKIKEKVFKYDKNCYQYIPVTSECSINSIE
jgi:hypothetical protein